MDILLHKELEKIRKDTGGDLKITLKDFVEYTVSSEPISKINSKKTVIEMAEVSPNHYAPNRSNPHPAYTLQIQYINMDGIKSRYYRCWPQKYSKLKKPIKIQNNINFDKEILNFLESLGEGYNKNVYGLESVTALEALWEALLEKEALESYKTRQRNNLTEMLWVMAEKGCTFEYPPCDKFDWWYGDKGGTGFINLLRYVFTISRHDAMATLEECLNFKISNLTNFTTHTYACESSVQSVLEKIYDSLTLRERVAESRHIFLVNKVYIYGYSKQKIGAIFIYELGKIQFCLSASVVRGELCLGKYQPKAYLLNENLLDEYSNTKVLFFQDMRVAIAVDERLKRLQKDISSELIVTACLSNDLNIIQWSAFDGRDVYFAPIYAPTHIAMIADYKKYIEGSNGHFNICRNLFSNTAPSKEQLQAVTQDNATLLEFINNAIWITDNIDILSALHRAMQNSCDYETFLKWGEDLGIYRKRVSESVSSTLSEGQALPKAPEYMSPPRANTISDVSFWSTFKTGNYILIIGLKGAGKTQLVLSICRQILLKGTQWPLFLNEYDTNENICVLDSETLQDEVDENLKQYGLTSFVNQRLFYLALKEEKQPEFIQNFSLTYEESQNALLRYLIKNKCRFLILDSLGFLTKNNPNARYAEVIGFIERLQGQGICVILTNHKNANDRDKIWSKQEYYNRARVIINMYHKDECDEFETSIKPLEAARKMDGLTVGLKYEHHKSAPCLEGKIFFFHLDLGSPDWQFLGQAGFGELPPEWLTKNKERYTPQNIETQTGQVTIKQNSESITQKVNALSPKLRQVYEAFKEHGRPATREELEKITGLSKDTLLERLNDLIDKVLVIKEGRGKDTFYKLVA